VSIGFDRPGWLLLALIAVPLALLALRAAAGLDPVRRVTAITVRALLIAAIAAALAGPRIVRVRDDLSVVALVDVSASVRRLAGARTTGPETDAIIRRAATWFQQAIADRRPTDRAGIVAFDGLAAAAATPTRGAVLDDRLDLRLATGTDVAAAIRLGLAMLPPDAAGRLVLLSDGNQTLGDAVAAAEEAAGGAEAAGVAIDVVPMPYRVDGELLVQRLEAPTTARPGQVVTLRVVLRPAQADDRPVDARLLVRHEGALLDLDPETPGPGTVLRVPPGTSVHLVRATLVDRPINRFEAILEPLEPARDRLVENNRAEAFTATPGAGSIAIVQEGGASAPSLLARRLETAGLDVRVLEPRELAGDLLALQRYDLIVLDDVPSSAFTTQQQDALARSVFDLGTGLVMVGGPRSFGAGGWKRSPVADVLPLDLDPPKELRLPTAALVLVMDKSGSMAFAVAGARASQMEVAAEGASLAVESLRDDTLVGVVTFDEFAHVHVPLQRMDDPAPIVEQIRAIRPDGGTNLRPALRRSYELLRDLDVDRKRVVCLSDGRSDDTDLDGLVERMRADGIRVTTIAVGDDADYETLERLADVGGGAFYAVRNPRVLPRVLVDSVQIVNAPLIKEGPFRAAVVATGSTLVAGLEDAPPLEGLVVTGPRATGEAIIDLVHPDGEPLLARWQAGLGRAAAFTSDVGGDWSETWDQWPTAAAFWTQLVRWTSRPPQSRDAELWTTLDGDRLLIQVDASDPEAAVGLTVEGAVHGPDGEARPVRLRPTGPGRFEASVPATEQGTYVVALAPRRGDRTLAPLIGGVSRAGSPELESLRSNEPLLERIAEVTGGRVLSLDDAETADLFDDDHRRPVAARRAAWTWPIGLAVALLLLDVAARRLAWNPLQTVAVLRRGVTAARHDRGASAATTLAGLRRPGRRPRDSNDDRATDLPSDRGPDRRRAAPIARRETDRDAAGPDEAASRARVRAALDRLSGRASEDEGDPGPAPVTDDAEDPTASPGDDDSASIASRLAARRRARRGDGDG